MKNPTLKLIAFFLGLFILTSCSDDDEKPKPFVEFPTEFSALTPEDNKANLEASGLTLVNNMNELKSTPGIRTSVSLNHFLSLAALPTTSGRQATSTQPLLLIRSLANFGTGKESASGVLSAFRLQQEDTVTTAQEVYDDLVGVFAFNAADSTWSHTPGSDGKIVFKFPSTRGGTTNDAQFVVSGYTSVQIENSDFTYTGDAPTALKAELVVAGAKQFEYAFAANYKPNGEPTLVTTSLTISPFVFAFEAKNTSTEVSVNFSLKSGDTNLISSGGMAIGNFGSGNVGTSENVGSVLTSSMAYFQIMGIKFAGEVDAVNLDNAMMAADTTVQQAEALNAYTNFVVFYAESNEKIADTEFYATSETESGTNCWEVDTNGDGIADGQECQPWSYVDNYVDVRVIFADGSKADLETYTSAGFDEITTELEAFVDAVEADLN